MKAVLAIFLMVALPLIAASCIRERCRAREFFEFKYAYNKVYANASEEYYRCKVFSDNLEMIERHNIRYKERKVSTKQAMNQFGDVTNKEFVATYTGLPKTPENPSNETTVAPSAVPIAPHSSHRRVKRDVAVWNVPNFVPTGNLDLRVPAIKVRNQGACGSCWAHAAVGLLEYYFYKKYNTAYDFSEQNFVDCARGSPYASKGCGGGFPHEALAYNQIYGVDFESVYPYRGVTQNCAYKSTTINGNGEPASQAPHWYTFPAGENNLALAALNYGWVAVCINADNLQFYAGGVFRASQCKLGPNHAVILVGYGTDTSGVPYWLIRNSWGASWGEAGYFRLERNRNACDIMYNYDKYRVFVKA